MGGAFSGGKPHRQANPDTAETLETLAESIAGDGAERSGVTGSRFLALAETLEGLADRLR